MLEDFVRPEIRALEAYVPGRSIEEIRQEYGIEKVIKMASNENPLGTSPLVQEVLARHAGEAFRYPAGGNPRLVKAIARYLGLPESRIAVGNGSDEIIDMIIRIMTTPGRDNIVCFEPCFSLYPIQSLINGVEVRREPLPSDFVFDFDKLYAHVDENTRLVFVTAPDNPSGYCPRPGEIRRLAEKLPGDCLLVVDEAYIHFAAEEGETEADWSLLRQKDVPVNVAFIRTFSKCYGLAGLRIGVGILPEFLAGYYWRARLPFSVNILAEEAAITALDDDVFRQETIETVRKGRKELSLALTEMGCTVYPSRANFLMFTPPAGHPALELYEALLRRGVIVRALKSYEMPQNIRVSVGSPEENKIFLKATREILGGGR